MPAGIPCATDKTVWMFWHDWSDAPDIARKSVESWTIRNPDWDVRPLCWSSVGDWLDAEVIARIRSLDICIQHQTDLLRLELLFRHGGVWADATSFCAWPLSDWLPDCLRQGFFAFRRDIIQTPQRPIANWFLAASAGSDLLAQLRVKVWAYWEQRARTGDYFWFHGVFANALTTDAGFAVAWEKVPAISCMHPFHAGPNSPALPQKPTEAHLRLLADPPAPVYKLTHKMGTVCGPESLLHRIVQETITPFRRHPVHPRIVLHVGLPKCASTTLQVWAHENRDMLRAHGVCYPQPSPGTGVPKHQELVRAFLQSRFQAAEARVAPVPEPVLFLSTEGFSNHFYDLERNPWAAVRMRALFRGSRLSLLMITREKDAWARSYHQQQIVNPPNPRYLHGSSLQFDDFLQQDRVRRLYNWEKLAVDLQEFYGAETIVQTSVEGDWQRVVTEHLGIPHMLDSLKNFPRQNLGLTRHATELLRQANAFGIETGRNIFIRLLSHIDRHLDAGKDVPPFAGFLGKQEETQAIAQLVSRLQATDGNARRTLDAMRHLIGQIERIPE